MITLEVDAADALDAAEVPVDAAADLEVGGELAVPWRAARRGDPVRDALHEARARHRRGRLTREQVLPLALGATERNEHGEHRKEAVSTAQHCFGLARHVYQLEPERTPSGAAGR